jgi:hypothetical protein
VAAHDVAAERVSASRAVSFRWGSFQFDFSMNFQTKVHLTLYSKVEDQGSLFNNYKG